VRLGLGGNLWGNRDFVRLWASDTVSEFGNQFTQFALPVLAVLAFRATPLQMGALGSLGFVAFPTLGLFVGVWADRFRKRRIMIVCNVGRLAILGSIPLGFVAGVLSMYQLYLVALLNGVFAVFFDVAYQAYLPLLVERGDLLEGNQKLQSSASAAQVVGPTLAGFLYQLIGGAFTVAVDAVGYTLSAISLASIRKVEPIVDQGRRRSFFVEMKEGIDIVVRNPILKRIAACTATTNLGNTMVATVITIFALNYLKFTPVELGVVGTIGAVGFLVGVLSSGRITRRLGLGVTLALAIGIGFVAMLEPLALRGYPFVVLSAIAFVLSFEVPLYNINQVSLRQAMTPQPLQGRMNATMRTIVWGTIPVGSVIGGTLGQILGVVNTIYIGGAISGLASLWILLGPVIRLKTQPPPVAEG